MKAQAIFLISFVSLLILMLFLIPFSLSDEPQQSEKTIVSHTKWATGEEICYSDNTCNMTLYSNPMNYYDGSEYVSINTTIVNSSDSKYSHEMTQGIYHVFFEDNLQMGEAVKFVKDDYHFIYDLSGGKIQWVEQTGSPDKTKSIGAILSSHAQPEGSVMKYGNAFAYTNVTYNIYYEMLKEKFYLSQLPLSGEGYLYLEYTGEVKYSSELTIFANSENQTGKSFHTSERIDFNDESGNTVFFLPPPTVKDMNNVEGHAYYDIKVSKGKIQFGLRVNRTFLENAKYPVIIDPSITLQTADTENLEDVNCYNNDTATLDAGVMIKWNISSIPSTANITEALLYLWWDHVSFSPDSGVNVSTVNNQTWIEENGVSAWNAAEFLNTSLQNWSSIVENTWGYINVTDLVKIEHSSNNDNITIRVFDPDYPNLVGNVTDVGSNPALLKIGTINNSALGGNLVGNSKEYELTTKRAKLIITYDRNLPFFNTNTTVPAQPLYLNNVTIQVNVTSDLDSIIWVNFTLIAPNGTWVINNTNGTNFDTDLWNSTSYNISGNDGQWNISVLASESDGDTAEKNWSFTVTNSPPTFDQDLTAQSLHHNANLSYDVNCSDADSNPITYSVNESKVSINSGTGVITDNPAQSEDGTYNISVICNDTLNATTQTFLYTIINDPPEPVNVTILPSPADTTDDLNCTYNYTDNETDTESNQWFRWYLNNILYTAVSKVEPDDNTVLLFHMDNETGYGENDTLVYDFSGLGNNGSVSGATWSSLGRLNGTFIFDGIDDYINASNSSLLNFGTGNFSIEFWMKTGSSASMRIISKILTSGYEVYIAGGYIDIYIWDGTNDAQNDPLTKKRNDNSWHHVAVLKNSSLLYLYIDGSYEGGWDSSSVGDINTTSDLMIGSLNGTGHFFNGSIDELIIYNRTLTAEEILNHSNLGAPQLLGSGNTSTGDNWTCSAKVKDGFESSSWVNSSSVNIGDKTSPILEDWKLSASSGYTDIQQAIYVNCSDALSSIQYVRVDYVNPNGENVGNKTMTLRTGDQYEYNYTFNIVGTYTNFSFHCMDQSGNKNSTNSTLNFTASTRPSEAPPDGGIVVIVTNITKFRLEAIGGLNLTIPLGIPVSHRIAITNEGNQDSWFFPKCVSDNETCSFINLNITKRVLVGMNKTSYMVYDILVPIGKAKVGDNLTFTITSEDAENVVVGLHYRMGVVERWGDIISLLRKKITIIENIPFIGGPLIVEAWHLILLAIIPMGFLYSLLGNQKGKFWITTSIYAVLVGIILFAL